MDRDEQKDLFIKANIRDGKIPEKIDDLFNNSLKLIENERGDCMNQEKQSNKNNVFWYKKVAAVAACAVIVLGGGNIYATTKGYDNVFFMIKEWIAPTEDKYGKEEILSDRDITMSYKTIEVAKGLKMQINRLVVKDNEAKLVLKIDKSELIDDIMPVTYIVRDESGIELCNYVAANEGNVYFENLKLDGLKEENQKLELEIKQADGDELVKFNIDIENKEIEVIGTEQELEKISEEELKKYLSAFALLNYEDEKINSKLLSEQELENVRKMMAACQIAEMNEIDILLDKNDNTKIDVSKMNELLQNFTDIEVKENGLVECAEYFIADKVNGKWCYTRTPDYFVKDAKGLCLDVEDIMYSQGIYTVTFTYSYPTLQDELDNIVEDLPVYEMTISLTLNDEYSRFRVSSKMESILVDQGKKTETNVDKSEPDNVVNNENEIIEKEETTTSNNNPIIVDPDFYNSEDYEEIKHSLIGKWNRTYNVDHEEDGKVNFELYEDGTFREWETEVKDNGMSTHSRETGYGTFVITQKDNWDRVILNYEDGREKEMLYGSIGESKENAKLHDSINRQVYTKKYGTNDISLPKIKQSLLGSWWRTYNVDHEEMHEFSLHFLEDGTFIEWTMKPVENEPNSKHSEKTGEGIYEIKRKDNWDIVILKYTNGEEHELLYGSRGESKENANLHYSIGQQLFKKI